MIWDMVSGDRTDMPFVGMEGDIYASDWSPDARRLLLTQFVQAQYQLHIYDIESATLTPLKHPTGTFNGGYFYDDSTIFVHHQTRCTRRSSLRWTLPRRTEARCALRRRSAASRPWRRCVPWRERRYHPGWLSTPEGPAMADDSGDTWRPRPLSRPRRSGTMHMHGSITDSRFSASTITVQSPLAASSNSRFTASWANSKPKI